MLPLFYQKTIRFFMITSKMRLCSKLPAKTTDGCNIKTKTA